MTSFWCPTCHLDLQSTKSLTIHQQGRKHRNRARAHTTAPSTECATTRAKVDISPQEIEETDFWNNLCGGTYKNIVVLTGAGISTAAGVPDFRSPGGLFEILAAKYASQFPQLDASPEDLFSRSFAQQYPDILEKELLAVKNALTREVKPTLTHKFCAHLAQKGWLKRIYTQNVDGLHTHPSLDISSDLVVECHGSIAHQNLVLYEDPLPERFFDMTAQDFDPNLPHEIKVDLLLVLGTSLQVAPFCALANMAPKGSTRVLVNRQLKDSLSNAYKKMDRISIGAIKAVSLASSWLDREKLRKRKWKQLLVEDDCDKFVDRYYTTKDTKSTDTHCMG